MRGRPRGQRYGGPCGNDRGGVRCANNIPRSIKLPTLNAMLKLGLQNREPIPATGGGSQFRCGIRCVEYRCIRASLKTVTGAALREVDAGSFQFGLR